MSNGKIKDLAVKYFNECKDYETGKWLKQPTTSGLAIAIGFNCADEMFNYKGKGAARKDVMFAISYLESVIEEGLYDKEKFQGSKFILTSRFKGWQGKEDNNAVGMITIIDDIKPSS